LRLAVSVFIVAFWSIIILAELECLTVWIGIAYCPALFKCLVFNQIKIFSVNISVLVTSIAIFVTLEVINWNPSEIKSNSI
jgi:hypothetical protein